jgi:hypothetical protein
MKPENIESFYRESQNFLSERKRRQVKQLVLLNNLQRGDQNIASTLLLTLFNRLLSSLYDNKLQIKFLPSQGITQNQINSYNILSQSDYLEMSKSKIDYDWVWDTLFFGRGYCETLQFDKKQKIMKPHIINPLVFGYDPYFENVQEWRYYWKWITKSKWDLKRLIKKGIITGIKDPKEIPSGIESDLWDYKVKRDAAKKTIEPAVDTVAGDVYQILEFYGYDDEGNKTVYWLDKGFSKILMQEKLDLEDDEEEGLSKWPIVVKEAFREPHSSVVFSVADLLEDKHRAKSVLLNLAFIAAKDRANPIYGYNPDKVKDISQFFQRQINQHIPMESQDAVWPLNTEDPMSQGLIAFISLLTQEANEPMGTGQVLQPVKGKPTTATERAIDQQLNDMAQSLQSKVLQFGESEFWSHWFHRYAKNGKELKTKIANIVGVKGVESTEIDFKDFNTDFPPGIFVYSAKEAEYKELVLRRDLMQLYPNLVQTIGPDGMRNFNKYVFFPKFLEDPSLIDTMFPKTLDELRAGEENEILSKDNYVQTNEEENHQEHIYIHRAVFPKTNAIWFHLAEHEARLTEQKKMIMQQQQIMQQMQMQKMQPQLNVGAEKRSPQEAASPLKTEINQTNQSQI